MHMPFVSIVTAFFNEEESLLAFRQALELVLQDLNASYEIILVDDHSSDGSVELAKRWASEDPHVRYLRLSRNCGSHAAFSAGLAFVKGDCAVLLAADLQDPPETIPTLLEKWESGNDVVWVARTARDRERWTTRFASNIYYWMMRRFALPEMPAKGADFLLIDRKVLDAYNGIPEKNTSFLAMILWMGYRQTSIEYDKKARVSGRSKWTFSKRLKLFIDSMVSFSYTPIRMISCLGLIMALSGFAYATLVVGLRFLGLIVEPGFAALMTVLLVGQGMIISMLGVLGEYLWRTFDESRGRPRYLIEEHLLPREVREGQSDRSKTEDQNAYEDGDENVAHRESSHQKGNQG